MKMGYELMNIKDEDIKFYKRVFSTGDYIKFLELLKDINIKSGVEINTIHKKLIENTLKREKRKLTKILKDRPYLIDNINTIISLGNRLQPLLRSFNEFDEEDIPI